MKKAGQIVLVRFPQTDLESGKLRPVLLIAQVPNQYDDWLVCMISSQIHQYIENLDEIMQHNSDDFPQSGLKGKSVIRVSRLAVATGEIMIGPIGEIAEKRLKRIRKNLTDWIKGKK